MFWLIYIVLTPFGVFSILTTLFLCVIAFLLFAYRPESSRQVSWSVLRGFWVAGVVSLVLFAADIAYYFYLFPYLITAPLDGTGQNIGPLSATSVFLTYIPLLTAGITFKSLYASFVKERERDRFRNAKWPILTTGLVASALIAFQLLCFYIMHVLRLSPVSY